MVLWKVINLKRDFSEGSSAGAGLLVVRVYEKSEMILIDSGSGLRICYLNRILLSGI
jgi:hypothetical protein